MSQRGQFGPGQGGGAEEAWAAFGEVLGGAVRGARVPARNSLEGAAGPQSWKGLGPAELLGKLVAQGQGCLERPQPGLGACSMRMKGGCSLRLELARQVYRIIIGPRVKAVCI